MRDLERWKDQVELSLDGRQIFFLFFGSAVAACVIFVAGVMVGKRIEQRGAPPAVEDPLAALDRLSSDEEDNLTFHEALSRGDRRHAPVREGHAPRKDDAPRAARLPDAPSPIGAAPPGAPAAAKKGEEPAPPPPHKAGEERYTLQLSAFTDKSDADELLRRIQSAGFRPYIVQSEVPGRGVFYRVRMGDFSSKKSAADAKTEFEHKQHMVVYVAKL